MKRLYDHLGLQIIEIGSFFRYAVDCLWMPTEWPPPALAYKPRGPYGMLQAEFGDGEKCPFDRCYHGRAADHR